MAAQQDTQKGQEPEAVTFEQGVEKLESVVQRLEEGKLPLDDSLRLYEEGIAAFRRCQQLLGEAELKVRKLVEDLEGGLKEEPFETPEP